MREIDIVVVGAGPAGLQSSIYFASEGMSTVLLEGQVVGGQIGQTPKLENLAGQPVAGVTGPELIANMRSQAEGFGVEFLHATASGIRRAGKNVELKSDNGHFRAKAVILAVGGRWIKLEVPGATNGEASGFVHYGPFACMKAEKRRTYVVIGGGNSALQGIMELAAHSEVKVFTRGGFKCSRYLLDRAEKSPNVFGYHSHECVEIDSGNRVATFRNVQNGQQLPVQCQNLFFCGGSEPNTGWLGKSVKKDATGFILCKGYATSVDGVFAVGDCRASDYRKSVAGAIGDAANCSTQVWQYLDKQGLV
jgi:thioredoxin reductase (NADPH)